MPTFSKTSLGKLASCHPLLQEIAKEAILYVDFSIVYGHRTKRDQDRLFETGFSEKKWPSSKHNEWPSRAFDAIPWPGGWKSKDKLFFFVAGVIISVAKRREIGLRWGGAWKGSFNKEGDFNDLAHFELLD